MPTAPQRDDDSTTADRSALTTPPNKPATANPYASPLASLEEATAEEVDEEEQRALAIQGRAQMLRILGAGRIAAGFATFVVAVWLDQFMWTTIRTMPLLGAAVFNLALGWGLTRCFLWARRVAAIDSLAAVGAALANFVLFFGFGGVGQVIVQVICLLIIIWETAYLCVMLSDSSRMACTLSVNGEPLVLRVATGADRWSPISSGMLFSILGLLIPAFLVTGLMSSIH